MGKRSNGFERVPRDFYPTPLTAVPPLIPHLRGVRTFAGDGCDGLLVLAAASIFLGYRFMLLLVTLYTT